MIKMLRPQNEKKKKSRTACRSRYRQGDGFLRKKIKREPTKRTGLKRASARLTSIEMIKKRI